MLAGERSEVSMSPACDFVSTAQRGLVGLEGWSVGWQQPLPPVLSGAGIYFDPHPTLGFH